MITSRHNSRVKQARKLAHARSRDQHHAFLGEGVRLIEDALRAHVLPHTVFFCAETLSARGERLLSELAKRSVELLACSESVFRSLSETVTPQGVAAILPLATLPMPARIASLLVLDQVRDPGNAGALLRSAEAAGVDCVLCSPQTVDPYNPKVVRAAMGAHFRLPIRRVQDWDEACALIDTIGQCFLADASGAVAYNVVDWSRPSVLIIGGEAEGASAHARRVSQAIKIPMEGAVESLNAAVAGSVILFEAARQRRMQTDGENQRIAPNDLSR